MGKGGDTAKGAASGAMAGAALGPWGAAAGGLIGGALGYFGSGSSAPAIAKGPETADYQRQYLKDYLARGAPMMNTAQSDQARAQQQQLAQMLFQQANGQRQGAGELAVQRQVNNAQANTTSAAQMARGANTAMAMRNAARTNADIGVNGAGQAGIAQLQDQQSAQNQLNGLLGTTRGQDISTAGANQMSQLQQQQLQMNALSQMLSVDQASLGQGNKSAELQAADQQRRDAQMAALMQAGGTAAAAYAGYSAKPPQMKPIAAGNPGAGGYWTPGGK